MIHNHDLHEHNQRLGPKNSSFKARVPTIPEVGTGKATSAGGFYHFILGGLVNYFRTMLCLLLCCPFLVCYE
jgi:hypothetical protein